MMIFLKSISKFQMTIFAILIAVIASLGYLFYDNYRTNIRDKEIIKQVRMENLDLTQDLEIVKEKYEKLKKDVDVLSNKVTKVSQQKKYYKKKKLSSAGKSSKYKKKRVNYKKLYFDLKRSCSKDKYSYKQKSKYK